MPRPPIPEPPYEGGCLCGAVRYRLNDRPLAVYACHCNDCKKLSGATNIRVVLAARDALSYNGAELAKYRKRADSGREIDILRCASCGVRLWHEPLSAPEFVLIAAGTLDQPGWAAPAAHIWTERAAPGIAFEEDAISIGGQPANRQMLIDAFAKICGNGSVSGGSQDAR